MSYNPFHKRRATGSAVAAPGATHATAPPAEASGAGTAAAGAAGAVAEAPLVSLEPVARADNPMGSRQTSGLESLLGANASANCAHGPPLDATSSVAPVAALFHLLIGSTPFGLVPPNASAGSYGSATRFGISPQIPGASSPLQAGAIPAGAMPGAMPGAPSNRASSASPGMLSPGANSGLPGDGSLTPGCFGRSPYHSPVTGPPQLGSLPASVNPAAPDSFGSGSQPTGGLGLALDGRSNGLGLGGGRSAPRCDMEETLDLCRGRGWTLGGSALAPMLQHMLLGRVVHRIGPPSPTAKRPPGAIGSPSHRASAPPPAQPQMRRQDTQPPSFNRDGTATAEAVSEEESAALKAARGLKGNVMQKALSPLPTKAPHAAPPAPVSGSEMPSGEKGLTKSNANPNPSEHAVPSPLSSQEDLLLRGDPSDGRSTATPTSATPTPLSAQSPEKTTTRSHAHSGSREELTGHGVKSNGNDSASSFGPTPSAATAPVPAQAPAAAAVAVAQPPAAIPAPPTLMGVFGRRAQHGNTPPVPVAAQQTWPRHPTGLTALPNGNIAVCTEDDSVLVLTAAGGLVRKLGKRQGQWRRGLAALPNGMLAVADGEKHQVEIMATDGRVHLSIGKGQHGPGQDEFNCPSGIAVLPPFASANAAMDAAAAAGDAVGDARRDFEIGHEERLPMALEDLRGVRLAVCDQFNNRVKVVTIGGSLLRCVGGGSRGTGELQFATPWGITETSTGSLAVCDQDNHRLKLISSYGRFIRHIGGAAVGGGGSGQNQFARPRGVVSLPNGHLAVSDVCNHRVKIVDCEGRFVRQFDDVRAALSTSDHDGGRVMRPLGIAVLPSGLLAVGDRDNDSISLLRP